jgi:septal ring factor EnvC (AmiA/AmiB activator)
MIFQDLDRIVFAGDSVTDMGSVNPVGEGLYDNLGHSYVRVLAISFLRLRAFTVTGGFEMATTKSMKIQAEIDKVKAKISEQQARLKELEQKKLEAENSEIVDIVRGMSISLTELPLLFEKLKDGGTLGQSVPKSEEEKKEEN